MPHESVHDKKKSEEGAKQQLQMMEQAEGSTFQQSDSAVQAAAGDGLTPRQKSVLSLQATHGNAAVQRFLAGKKGAVQRDNPPAPAATPRYAPPAMVAGGTLPDNARIDSLGAVPDLNGQIMGSLPGAFGDTSYATAATIRTALNRETLRNNFNAYQGSGVSVHLQQTQDFVATFDGDMVIQARIKNVRFVRADGVQIGDAATSGVSATGSGSSATATGVSGEVSGNVGDAKAGGNVGGKAGGSSVTTVTSGTGTTTGGTGTRTVSPNASAVFSFDVDWTVTVRYQRSPRTWNAIMTLGISAADAAIHGNDTRSITATGSGGQVRIPVVDCTEVH